MLKIDISRISELSSLDNFQRRKVVSKRKKKFHDTGHHWTKNCTRQSPLVFITLTIFVYVCLTLIDLLKWFSVFAVVIFDIFPEKNAERCGTCLRRKPTGPLGPVVVGQKVNKTATHGQQRTKNAPIRGLLIQRMMASKMTNRANIKYVYLT